MFNVLYKPRFCCNCGEKIERVDWNLLTSRRFCDVCAAENRFFDYGPRIAVAGGILAAVFGLGSVFGSRTAVLPTENSARQAVSPGQGSPAQSNSKTAEMPAAAPQSSSGNGAPAGIQPPTQQAQMQLSPTMPASPPKTDESAYFCGALTKKGTPCSRRVKRKGERCWQHSAVASTEALR